MIRKSARALLDVGDLREWLAEEEPLVVNHTLRLLLRGITVTDGQRVSIELRV